MPKVSVLMPIYKTNHQYLHEAIESVLNQTYADFEFLILNDSPDDKSLDNVIELYKDERIKYIKNEKNLGITPSRNKLIDLAKGEYLAVMDHDDISLPTRFEKQVAFLESHPDIGVVGCQVQRFSGKMIKNPTDDFKIKMALFCKCAITHPASMIRKSVFTLRNLKYEERFSPSEDYALWCRLIPYTNFHNIPEILFKYRDHTDNTSTIQNKKMQEATFIIRSFAEIENPILYKTFLLCYEHIDKIKLFGIFPFLKIVKKRNRIKIYLFEKILVLSCKKIHKI